MLYLIRNPDNAVRIATGYGLNSQGVEFEFWYEQDFSPLIIQIGSEAPQPSIQWVSRALFTAVKQPWCEVNYST
jgi:hypothetical protein